MSRRAVRALLLLFVVVWTAPVAFGGDGTRKVSSAGLAPGLAYEQWAVSGSSARAHVARIAQGSNATLSVVQAEGRLATGRETTSAICARTSGCKVAVNGDFFGKDGPVGGVVIDGRLLRTPDPHHEQLSLQPLRATTSGFGKAGWSGTVAREGSSTLPVHGVNVALEPDKLVLYTAAYGATTPPCQCAELVLRETGQPVGVLDRPGATVLDRRASGQTPLANGAVVLAGNGAAARRLAALAAAVDRGGDQAITITLTTARPVRQSLGAHPVLLRGGKAAAIDSTDAMLREPEPRTAVGWDKAGNAFLVAFDGRQDGGAGPTAAEAADFLLQLGATEAVLLDGGGSSTMAVPRRVLNAPSDGSERRVSNAVVVSVATKPAARRAPPAAVKAPSVVAVVPPVVVGRTFAPGSAAAGTPPVQRLRKAAPAVAVPPTKQLAPEPGAAAPTKPPPPAVARAAPQIAPMLAVAPVPVSISTPGTGVTRTAAVLWALVAASWLIGYVVTGLRRG